MQTQAEKQFNDDYLVMRHLLITTKNSDGKVRVKQWLRDNFPKMIDAIAKEMDSELMHIQLSRPSPYEKTLMDIINDSVASRKNNV